MAGPILSSCCGCQSLRVGSIVSGVCGILLAIAALLVMFLVRVEFKTIVFDALPAWAVKTILVINLCMTILISLFLIIGVLKRNFYLMLPWVVLGLMIVIGLLFSIIYTAVVFFIDDKILTGVLWLVFGLITTAIYLYMWMVTFSHFMVLKEESDRGRYAKQPYRR